MAAFAQSLAARGRTDGLKTLDDDELSILQRAVSDALAEFSRRVEPARHDQVADMLLAFAEMLGVEEPGDKGIGLYLKALSDLPAIVIEPAQVELARTHKYKRLPNPAEIRSAAALFVTELDMSASWYRQCLGLINDEMGKRGAFSHREFAP